MSENETGPDANEIEAAEGAQHSDQFAETPTDEPLSQATTSLTRLDRSMGLVYVALLLLDVVLVTLLAAWHPEQWGVKPLFIPLVLAVTGWVVFKWAPGLRPEAADIEAMLPLRRTLFRVAMSVISISRLAAIAIALGCMMWMLLALGAQPD